MLFQYWTEEEFPSLFRKVLTLEQYRNEKMAQLYRYYLTDGPIEFMTELFSAMLDSQENIDPKQVVLDFYGPIYMLICMYDIAEDKTYLDQLLVNHINHFL